MKNQPLHLISWHDDFLSNLLEHIIATGEISQALIIVPHRRPEQYLQNLLSKHPTLELPLLLPSILPIGSLFTLLRQHLCQRTAKPAGTLDTIGLLMHSVRHELAKNAASPSLFSPLQDSPTQGRQPEDYAKNAQQFFPWGLRLAALFEECFNHHCSPQSFQYMEGEVVPFAASLLDNLAAIYQHYVDNLQQQNWTTAGLDASAVIDALESGLALPEHLFKGKKVYISGFHAFNRTEELLFKHLWQEHGAKVIVHADPKLARGEKAHWSCENFVKLAKNWQTAFEQIDSKIKGSEKTEINFVAGFDLHSQLKSVAEELKNQFNDAQLADNADGTAQVENYSASIAVVLPDSGLLLPTLHHLPKLDCNISMGYPLNRSPLFILLNTIFALQEKRLGKQYYWKDLLELFRHPYLKMLAPTPSETGSNLNSDKGSNKTSQGASGIKDLRTELHRLEKLLRDAGQTYIAPEELFQKLLGEMPDIEPQSAKFVLAILKACLENFENTQTTKDLGQSLQHLCQLLLWHGTHLWERFPIDAECLYRLVQSLVPELLQNSLAEEKFSSLALFNIARQLIDTQRVPFEASPLVGLQVMGVLETRMLSFSKAIIVECTDANLPGTNAGDPLLPDSLRPILGLPSRNTREQVAAYNFFRLIKSSKQVTIYWQEGSGESALQDQIPQKSRFIEELLWEQEKEMGRLLATSGQDENLRFIESSIAPIATQNKSVLVSSQISALIQKRLEKPVSASFLNAYLQCPVRWYYEQIARLNTPEEIAEKNDPLAVGNLLHSTLQTFYAPYLGLDMPQLEDNFESSLVQLLQIFDAELQASTLPKILPADAINVLKASAKLRLKLYLENQPPTKILALEKNLLAPFTSSVQSLNLQGRVDRVDLRDNNVLVVLDYKTGKIKKTRNIWTDQYFWNNLKNWTPAKNNPESLLEVYSNIPNLQLPFYLLLLENNAQQVLSAAKSSFSKEIRIDAAFVDLGQSGKEENFIGFSGDNPEVNDEIKENIKGLMDFTIRHMVQSTEFYPHPSELCSWCSVQKMCKVFCK